MAGKRPAENQIASVMSMPFTGLDNRTSTICPMPVGTPAPAAPGHATGPPPQQPHPARCLLCSFSARNNGLGISRVLLPHVFELSVQSSRTIAARAGDLRVRRAVVKAVAEFHGGTVSATNAGPGTDSEFTLRLPIVTKRCDA
jgi:signal transduction histidine kinase